MAKLTNKFNLPQVIVEAVKNDPYSRGKAHISVTGLTSPPRIRVLTKKHEAELEEDVSDRGYSLLGQLMHLLLERAAKTLPVGKVLIEERFFMDIEGITISGALDAFYLEGLIQDYKLMSYHKISNGVPPEFEAQQNMYAAILRANGYTVDKLQLVCVFRDWSKGKARMDEYVPQQQITTLDVTVWSQEKAVAHIKERIRLHKEANKKLPQCTPEERWAQPDKWAVMPKKNGKKQKSLKNHLTKEQAEMHAANVPGSFVQDRPGKSVRCEDGYCQVSSFCEQFQKIKRSKNAKTKQG